jgi:hypothetical protein
VAVCSACGVTTVWLCSAGQVARGAAMHSSNITQSGRRELITLIGNDCRAVS